MNPARAAAFIAQGLKPSQVATLVGCTPAYITQLAATADFQELVVKEKEALNTKGADIEEDMLSAKYAVVEHKLLNHLEISLSLLEPKEISRTLQVIADRQEKMKSRKLAATRPQTAPTVTVNLSIPQHAIPEYLINERNEIISINQRPMAALSSTGVKALFEVIAA